MSSPPEATIETRTTVDVDTHAGDDHDGILPEPTREDARVLWRILVVTLSTILLLFAGVFAYLAWKGAIDSAALVGLFGLVLAGIMDLYRRRQG